MKKLKSPLNIALCVLTAVLCVTLLAALCMWIAYADSTPNLTALAAKDICHMLLPIIGICVMFIIISVRSTPGRGKEK